MEGQSDGLVLGDLRGTYRDRPAVSPRAARVSRWLTVIGVAVLVGWALLVVLRGRAEDMAGPAQVAVIAVLTGLSTQRTPWTRLSDDGLVVSRLPFERQRHGWPEVADVRLPGRWEEGSTAVLHDGRLVPLPGLPVEVAERLSRVVAPDAPDVARPGPPPQPPRSARDGSDEGWEGPFRRGHPRR